MKPDIRKFIWFIDRYIEQHQCNEHMKHAKYWSYKCNYSEEMLRYNWSSGLKVKSKETGDEITNSWSFIFVGEMQLNAPLNGRWIFLYSQMKLRILVDWKNGNIGKRIPNRWYQIEVSGNSCFVQQVMCSSSYYYEYLG